MTDVGCQSLRNFSLGIQAKSYLLVPERQGNLSPFVFLYSQVCLSPVQLSNSNETDILKRTLVGLRQVPNSSLLAKFDQSGAGTRAFHVGEVVWP